MNTYWELANIVYNSNQIKKKLRMQINDGGYFIIPKITDHEYECHIYREELSKLCPLFEFKNVAISTNLCALVYYSSNTC